LAIIDQLNLTFGPGFNVLTGETGAGKSIIIDAVGLLLGDRASQESTGLSQSSSRVQCWPARVAPAGGSVPASSVPASGGPASGTPASGAVRTPVYLDHLGGALG
jgi:energy-coupling factor transporter ATP-binding protein EcfA2